MKNRIVIVPFIVLGCIGISGCDGSSNEGGEASAPADPMSINTLEAVADMPANSDAAILGVDALTQELALLTTNNQAQEPVSIEAGDTVVSLLRKARNQ